MSKNYQQTWIISMDDGGTTHAIRRMDTGLNEGSAGWIRFRNVIVLANTGWSPPPITSTNTFSKDQNPSRFTFWQSLSTNGYLVIDQHSISGSKKSYPDVDNHSTSEQRLFIELCRIFLRKPKLSNEFYIPLKSIDPLLKKEAVFTEFPKKVYSPFELGLLPSISQNKGCYVGNEVMSRYIKTFDRLISNQKQKNLTMDSPIKYRLVHVQLRRVDSNPSLPLITKGCKIVTAEGEEMGEITSSISEYLIENRFLNETESITIHRMVPIIHRAIFSKQASVAFNANHPMVDMIVDYLFNFGHLGIFRNKIPSEPTPTNNFFVNISTNSNPSLLVPIHISYDPVIQSPQTYYPYYDVGTFYNFRSDNESSESGKKDDNDSKESIKLAQTELSEQARKAAKLEAMAKRISSLKKLKE